MGLQSGVQKLASLYFIIRVDNDSDENSEIFEFIHCLVECLDKYFSSVVHCFVLGSLLVLERH